MIEYYIEKLRKKVKSIDYRTIKMFVILILILVISISSIIRANFNFNDDIGRVAFGYKGWGNFSRYLSNLFSVFLHTNKDFLTDISPLPQLISVVLMAFVGVLLLRIIYPKEKLTIGKLLPIVLLANSPYFLECLSYKYDAPYMAFSISISVIPLLMYKKRNIIYIFLSVVCILAMCLTYQVSSGIYPMLVAFLFLKNWNDKSVSNKENFKFLGFSIISYVMAMILFQFFITPVDDYVSTSILPFSKLISGSIIHFKEYFNLFFRDFKIEWIILIGIMILSSIWILVSNSKQNKIVSFFVTIIFITALLLLAFGVYPFLEKPLYSMRAMYGIGFFLLLISMVILTSKKNYFFKGCSLLLIWCFIVFTFTYGNALSEQKRYTDFRIQMILSDLQDLELMNNDKEKTIILNGSIGKSPIIENMLGAYPVLNRMIPETLSGDYVFAYSYFYNYFKIPNIHGKFDYNLEKDEMTILKESVYQNILGSENIILIQLK